MIFILDKNLVYVFINLVKLLWIFSFYISVYNIT